MKHLLHALDPRAFFGPIFFKEMLVSGRRSFTHWARFATGLLLAFFLWIILRSYMDGEVTYEVGAARIRAYGLIAPAIALSVGWIMATALPIIAAALGSGTMLEEKQGRTMESILSTPMNAWTIVASKVSSRVMQVLILSLITLPILLASRTFGGLSLQNVFAFTLVTICQAIFATVIATWFSLRVKKAWSAMTSAVAATITLSVIPFVPAFIGGFSDWSQTLMMWLLGIALHLSPIGALVLLSIDEQSPMPGGLMPFEGSTWVVSSAWCLLLSWIIMSMTAARLRLEAVGKVKQRVTRSKRAQRKAAVRKGRKRSRTVFGNPVAWRELRQPLFKGARTFKIVGVFIGAGALIYLYTQADPTAQEMHYSLIFICFFISCLTPLNATTGSVAGEREARTLDVLLSTPMSAWSILFGKLLGAFPMPMLILQFVTLHTVIYSMVGFFRGDDIISPLIILHTMCLGVGVAAMLGGSGVLFSVLFRRNSMAMVANIALWIGVWAGVPMVLGILGIFMYDSLLQDLFFVTNPFALLASALSGDVVGYSYGGYSGYGNYNSSQISYEYTLADGSDIGPVGFSIMLGFWCLAAVCIGLFFTWIASKRLAAKTQRPR